MSAQRTLTEQLAEAERAMRPWMEGRVPKIGLVLGSGLNALAESLEDAACIDYGAVPYMGVSTASLHVGRFVCGTLDGTEVLCMQGRIHGYEGVPPNTFVNRTVVKNANDEDEVPLDVLAGLQPKKLYLMVGTNALVVEGNDEGFLNYYARLLDELGAMLPDCMIFVQSVLPVRPEALADAPGLASARLESINASLRAMCAEKGCYYLDVASAFRGEDGALLAEYAQPDGIHLTVSGYTAWVDYLCTHVPYDKNNPYQPGSAWYLDAGLKDLIADIP